MRLTNNPESERCFKLASELIARGKQITLHLNGNTHMFFPAGTSWRAVTVYSDGIIKIGQHQPDIHEDLYYLLTLGAELPTPPTVIIDTEGGVVHGVCVTEGAQVNVIVVDRDEDEQDADCNVEAREIEGTFENIDWEVLGKGSSFIVK